MQGHQYHLPSLLYILVFYIVESDSALTFTVICWVDSGFELLWKTFKINPWSVYCPYFINSDSTSSS